MMVGIDRGSDRRFEDHARDLDLQFRAFRKEMPLHDEPQRELPAQGAVNKRRRALLRHGGGWRCQRSH
jgi:hypothetical protein